MKALKLLILGFFVVGLLAYLNIIIPRPQSVSARTYNDDKGYQAQEFPCNQGNCSSSAKVLKIAVHESPACTSGTLSSLTDYKGAAWFQNESGDTYKYHVVWASYFCANATTGSCTSTPLTNSTDFTLGPNQTTQTYSPTRNESDLTCGKVQTDMSFQAWKKVGENWVLALSYGDLGNPGNSNATYTYCSTGKACPTPTHKTCQDNACVSVEGSGTSTCNSNSDCQPQTHKACQDNACKVVAGPGADSCSNNFQCQAQTHKGCWQNACRVLRGPGADTCTSNSQCQTEQHHFACVDNACTQVNGGGTNTCSSNADCTTPTHKACSDNACVVVQGSGSSSCSTDNDCKTPTHRACVSNACTIVLGSGSDSCSQDSECQTSSCSGTNCGNINITVEQHQQQQQQQAVLGASVAPASNPSSLPSTGAGADVLFGLLSLIPAGLKLRKWA